MRIIILSLLFWIHVASAELAQPPTPVFLRTVLVTGSGATPQAAQQQAFARARVQTDSVGWPGVHIANYAVVSMVPAGSLYHTQMWVTVKSIH